MVYGNQSSDICYSSAVNVCENCGQSCDELIDLPSWNFKACATCAEDAAREDARQAAKPCINCKTEPARWNSLYCSDRCKRAFLYFPEQPRYASIGNGLYVRTAAPKKRGKR